MTIKKPIYLMEIFVFFIFISSFTYIVLPYLGGPQTWDELLYLNLSLNTTAEPTVLFRYTHIYLQKVFLLLFPGNVIQASKIFWLFMCGTTLFFIFRLAYKLTGKNFFLGVLASYFFLIQTLVFQKYLGVTYADFTVMFFGILIISVFFSERLSINTALFVLPFLFALALKAKETSLPFALVLIAFLLKHKENLHLKRYLFFVGGALSAIVLFIILDGLFLHQPFFSLSPASMGKRAAFDLFSDFERTKADWVSFILKTALLIPFIFYLKTIFVAKDKSLSEAIVILSPITVIALLVLTMITGTWGIEDRYIFPAIPALCIFSAVSIVRTGEGGTSMNLKQQLFYLLVFLTLFPVSHVIDKIIAARMEKFGWDTYNLHYAIYMPLCILFLIVVISLGRFIKNSYVLNTSILFTIVFYTSYDLKVNLITLKKKDALLQSEARFKPFADFKRELENEKSSTLFISSTIYKETRMLGRDNSSMTWMYNSFFNSDKTTKQIVTDSLSQTLFVGGYNALLLHQNDIEKIKSDSIFYNSYSSIEKTGIVLLKKKTK